MRSCQLRASAARLWVATSLVSLVLVAGCGSDSADTDQKRLVAALRAEIKKATTTGKPFALSEATEFDWDRLYVFGPYASGEQIDRTLPGGWSGAPSVERDDQNLLVFASEGDVAEHVFLWTRHGDFTCVGTFHRGRGGFARGQARFRARRLRRGSPSVAILPARFASQRERTGFLDCLETLG